MRRILFLLFLAACISSSLKAQVIGIQPEPCGLYGWNATGSSWTKTTTSNAAQAAPTTPRPCAFYGWNATLGQWTPFNVDVNGNLIFPGNLFPGVISDGNSGLTVTGNVSTSNLTANTTTTSANNVISVTAGPYNAKGNLTQFSSGSISAGSATLNGTGFTPAMATNHYKVVVWGAGANNGNGGNPNYGPLVTTVSAYVSPTQVTLVAHATTAVPNATSNPNGQYEIGNDDTAAIQQAYCAAAANQFSLYFPPNVGSTSYWTAGIDMSCGKTNTFVVPMMGSTKYVSSITGVPGQHIIYWPDGFNDNALSTNSEITNLTLNSDPSIDTSCANSVGATCATMADGQPAVNRVSGFLIPARGAVVSWVSTGTFPNNSVTVTASGTPWLSTAIDGGYSAGGQVNFQGCTSALSALNWTGANWYPVTAGTSNTVTFTAPLAAGSGTDSCSVYGGQPASIAVGQSGNTNGGTLTFNSGDSDYDLVNIASFTGAPGQWDFIGQPFVINHATTGLAIYTGTISAVTGNFQLQLSGGGCSACFATSTAYSATNPTVTLTIPNSYSVGDIVKIAATGSDPLAALNGLNETITAATSSQISFTAASISTGSGSTAATTLLTSFPYFFGSTSVQTPPWYVGACAIAFPASAASGGVYVPRRFENLTINSIGPINHTNHNCGFFFQGAPYNTLFKNISVNATHYCYLEAPYLTNSAVTWTPDTMQVENMNCTTRVGPIEYAGNIRHQKAISIYMSGNWFNYAFAALPGPNNEAGGSRFDSFYHEPGTGNFGEDVTITGQGMDFYGASFKQGFAGYVNFAARNSFVAASSFVQLFNSATPAFKINGTGNIFTAMLASTISSNGTFGSGVQDLAGGNQFIGSDDVGPASYNLQKCMPGASDFGFLLNNAATPYASQCSLVFDYTTLAANSIAANIPVGSSYVQSTPGDGNPTAGYLFLPSSIVTGNQNLINHAYPMAVGTIIPVGTMNVEIGGYVGTPGTYSVSIKDMTLNTTLVTCPYSMTSTFAVHGYINSTDACTLTTNSGQAGHLLSMNLVTAPSAVGGVHFAFGALVPQGAPVSATVTNLQAPAWLTWLGDGTDGALSVTSGTQSISGNGEKWYSSLSISSGATLYYAGTTLNSPTVIRVTGACNIAGTLSVSVNSSSFPGNSSTAQMGAGGGGGGGGTGAGTAGSASSPPGSAGSAGTASGGTGGNGSSVSNVAYRPLISNFSNVLATNTTSVGGAAGGAGGSSGGAGGKGGGLIVLDCGSLTFTGTIDASGGVGTNAPGNNTGGGGGGGGGIVIVRSNNVATNTGTINVNGGAGGTCGSFTGCGPGGTGGTGWSYVIPH